MSVSPENLTASGQANRDSFETVILPPVGRLEAYGPMVHPVLFLLGIIISGNSQNLIAPFEQARALDSKMIGLTG